MSLVRLTWDDKAVLEALKRMKAHRATFAPVFKELKKPFRDDLKAHAERERGPDGKWPARDADTTARLQFGKAQRGRLKKGHAGPVRTKIVRQRSKKLLGKLPTAVTFRARGMSIMAVSKVPWSEVMNTGGKVGRGSFLPQREFLFVSDGFKELAGNRMAEYVVKEFGR